MRAVEFLLVHDGRFAILALAFIGFVIAVAACGQSESSELKLGDVLFQDHGTKSVAGVDRFTLESGNFYFSPTFLQGDRGQEVTLRIRNVSPTHHNFTIEEQGINVDVEVNQAVDVKVTFPQSGALLFTCLFHVHEGMNGELLAGDATPTAPNPAPSQAP